MNAKTHPQEKKSNAPTLNIWVKWVFLLITPFITLKKHFINTNVKYMFFNKFCVEFCVDKGAKWWLSIVRKALISFIDRLYVFGQRRTSLHPSLFNSLTTWRCDCSSNLAASHYPNQYWPRPISSYGVTRSQWANGCITHYICCMWAVIHVPQPSEYVWCWWLGTDLAPGHQQPSWWRGSIGSC